MCRTMAFLRYICAAGYLAQNKSDGRAKPPKCVCAFKDWGGRGVTMFPLWRDSFTGFALYVLNTLGERPSRHSLDRIDNSLGYVPGNLRWATAKEQAANRRVATMPQTRWVRFAGEEYSVNAFAQIVGRSHKAVSYRLDRGESAEQIATHYGYTNVATLPVAA